MRVRDLLSPFEARLRRREALSWATWAAGVGLVAALLLALAGRIFPLLPWPRLSALCLLLVAAPTLAAMAAAWLRPRSLLTTARRCDRELGLSERLSTAVELGSGSLQTNPRIAEAQLRDAERRLAAVSPGQALPWRPSPRRAGILLALTLALAATFAFSNPQEVILQRRAREQETIAQETAKLERLRAELIEDRALLNTPQGEMALETLEDLIAEMKAGGLSPEGAMAAISAAEGELGKLQAAAAARRAGLSDAAQALGEHEATADAASAMESQDYDAAASSLEALSGSLPTDPQEARDVAAALRAASTRLAPTDPNLAADLEAAAQALESGDRAAAQQALSQAAQAMAQAGQDLAGQEVVEKALARIQGARRAVAQAGEGEGGDKAQLQAGKVAGQSVGVVQPRQGGGSGSEDPGPGEEGLTAEKGTGGQVSTAAQSRGKEGSYEPVYAPLHLGGEEGLVTALPKQGQPGDVPVGEVPGRPPQQSGGATVPYDQVYADYRRSAASALQSSYIPLGMKEYVRQYFSALEPQQP